MLGKFFGGKGREKIGKMEKHPKFGVIDVRIGGAIPQLLLVVLLQQPQKDGFQRLSHWGGHKQSFSRAVTKKREGLLFNEYYCTMNVK